jgi:nicotinate-nucleotide adenylyltransferase
VFIGLFFGSFNPIHIGHLIIANSMVELTDLEQVWFVVTPQNPFKKSNSLLHEFDRLDMVELAIEDNFNLRATDVEFHMPKPSFTIDTLAYLADKYPQHQFKLIIGEDNMSNFHKWKNYERILDHFGLLVYPRPNIKPSSIKNHPNIRMVDAPLLDISATYVRQLVQENKSIKYLVPEKVANYIYDRKIFIIK